jgi:hypothetical protein
MSDQTIRRILSISGILCLNCSACFAQQNSDAGQNLQQHSHGATAIGAQHQTPSSSAASCKTGTTNALQPNANPPSPPPTSVRYLNYAQYDPWSFVPQTEQRNLAVPSPGYGRNGMSVSTPADSKANSPSNNGTATSATILSQYHGPSPREMRQHYAHYIPGAFSQSNNAGQDNGNPMTKASAPSVPVLKYTDEYTSPLNSSPGAADSYQSRLNF